MVGSHHRWGWGTSYSADRQWFITKINVLRLVLFLRRQFKRWGPISNTTLGPVAMVGSHHRRGKGRCTAIIGNGLWQKCMHWCKFCLSDVNSSVGGQFQTPHWAPVAMAWSPHRRGWEPWTAPIGNGLWQKSMYWAWFCLYNVNSSVVGWFQTPHWAPVSMVRSHHRRGFITKIHVLSLVLFVRRQFKRWWLISNTTLGPSGHGKKPPSSRLGTLYSSYRQWSWQKSMYWAWFLFVRRQFNRWGLISNTILGPSGHGRTPPSSRLGTLCSAYSQWVMTKIHVLRLV